MSLGGNLVSFLADCSLGSLARFLTQQRFLSTLKAVVTVAFLLGRRAKGNYSAQDTTMDRVTHANERRMGLHPAHVASNCRSFSQQSASGFPDLQLEELRFLDLSLIRVSKTACRCHIKQLAVLLSASECASGTTYSTLLRTSDGLTRAVGSKFHDSRPGLSSGCLASGFRTAKKQC